MILVCVDYHFSVVIYTCLKKRIPTKAKLETHILACVKEREKKNIKISWKFDITHARRKMNKHDFKLNSANQKFKEI